MRFRNELDRIMAQHGLTARQVGDVVGRKPHTVRQWRANVGGRGIPAQTLELLRLKIGATA